MKIKKYKSFDMKKAILLISILSLLHFSCIFDSFGQYTYRPPENINDGLNVGSLDEVNIESKLIVKAVNKIHRGMYKEMHSMLIFKDDKLVFEEYFKGHKYKYDGVNHHGELLTWDRTMLQNTHSVTKSITSACIGVAINNGFIESVHQSIFDYLPEYQHLNTDGKDKITIEHLLTMTSGFNWNETNMPYGNLENDIIKLFKYEDPINYVLNKSLGNKPGEIFNYNGGGIIVLGEIIKNATKMNIDEFSGKYFFGPLGIDPYYWKLLNNDVIYASGDIDITPRDMTKIGVAFLNNGVWKEEQIISKQWVDKSSTSFPVNDWEKKGYAYSWWTYQFELSSGKSINMFSADGWGGQYIMVFPELNSVIIFTGANYLTKTPAFKILEKYIIPAFNKL